MKRIEAFIAPHRLSKVVHALHELQHFSGFTVHDAKGQGRGRGAGGHYAYGDDCLEYHDRQIIILICEDDQATSIAEAIARAAHTGNKGDGMVVISDVGAVLRIRSAHPKVGGQP